MRRYDSSGWFVPPVAPRIALDRPADCLIFVVPTEFSAKLLTDLKQALSTAGFVPYSTVVGGRGFGVHVPACSSASGLALERAEGGSEVSGVPVGKKFEATRKEELSVWAQNLGDWTFV